MLRICHAAGVPVVPQGGLTGLTGGAVPVRGAVLLSLERLRAIEEVDPVGGTITVQAGVPLQAAQEAADAADDMLFSLDIGGRGSCLIGGKLSTNAGGNGRATCCSASRPCWRTARSSRRSTGC